MTLLHYVFSHVEQDSPDIIKSLEHLSDTLQHFMVLKIDCDTLRDDTTDLKTKVLVLSKHVSPADFDERISIFFSSATERSRR